ncbi:MAG: ABC transporter permease, partial [Geminicoccaceae bacterium]
MALLVVKRLVTLILTLAVATLVVFVVMEVLPGDPAALMLGVNARPDTLAALRAELGLDQPVVVRYLAWVGGLLCGDFGQSYTYSVPVGQLIAERIALSLPLALIAIVLSTTLAIPLGVLAAARRGRASDLGVMGFAQLGVAVPNFWFAIL